jgi:hypothetical protein
MHRVNEVRQTKIHTADALVPEPRAFEVEMVIEKQKTFKSPCIDQILAQLINTVVPKVCSAVAKGIMTSSQAVQEYISVMATLKFTYFFKLKEGCFAKNNSETSLIGDVFI